MIIGVMRQVLYPWIMTGVRLSSAPAVVVAYAHDLKKAQDQAYDEWVQHTKSLLLDHHRAQVVVDLFSIKSDWEPGSEKYLGRMLAKDGWQEASIFVITYAPFSEPGDEGGSL